MVNMAISMDPLQANRVLGALDHDALAKQKQNLMKGLAGEDEDKAASP